MQDAGDRAEYGHAYSLAAGSVRRARDTHKTESQTRRFQRLPRRDEATVAGRVVSWWRRGPRSILHLHMPGPWSVETRRSSMMDSDRSLN